MMEYTNLSNSKIYDYMEKFNCSEDQIALSLTDINENTVVIDLPVVFGKDLEQPFINLQYISGTVNVQSANLSMITFPKIIGGDLIMDGITDLEGVILPEAIGGRLEMPNVVNPNINWPKVVGGVIDANGLSYQNVIDLPACDDAIMFKDKKGIPLETYMDDIALYKTIIESPSYKKNYREFYETYNKSRNIHR